MAFLTFYEFIKIKNRIRPNISQKMILETCGIDTTPQGIPLSNHSEYCQWLLKHYPDQNALQQKQKQQKSFSFRPKISLIVPVFNTDKKYLETAIKSVLQQVYDNWQLCIADDGSSKPHIARLLKQYRNNDDRIHVVFCAQNEGIAAASNAALAIATGDFIGFLDHDDVLAPHALFEVVGLLNRVPDADFIYTDEDKIDQNNRLCDPFFKPEWSPDTLLSKMYTLHFSVFRRSLLKQLEGLNSAYDGAQDYDLALRATEETRRIYHIPKVLYHWRIHPESIASGHGNLKTGYAYGAAKRAVEEALRRRGENAVVETIADLPGIHIIHYSIKTKTLVSVIIIAHELLDLDQCINSLVATNTDYPHYEIIIVHDKSIKPAVDLLLNKLRQQIPQSIEAFAVNHLNPSQMYNHGVNHSNGDHLLFLSSKANFITKEAISSLLAQAQRPEIGCVGAFLLSGKQKILHAGIIFGIKAGAANCYFGENSEGNPGYFSQLMSVSNYAAVAVDCLMCKRGLFVENGGFDDTLNLYYDIDLCLRLLMKQYCHVCLPYVKLQIVKADRINNQGCYLSQREFAEEWQDIYKRWQAVIDNDPYYNPNLSRNAPGFIIA